MIPKNTDTYEVASTLKGKRIEMAIKQSAMMHIMDVLTNLYNDPELAVIREYSTNALDSHIEAGQTRPIEVSLPGPLKPTLEIQDWGTGMNLQDIEQIYSQYGETTKNETNDQVGMLGFGCKSGLAYAPQFTLVGIKNGEKTVVSVSRSPEGAGVMTVLDAIETDEPNGVRIIIPTKGEYYSIIEKANDFFQYWEEGTVLVNGQPPERFKGEKVTDDIYISATGHWNAQDYIIMGGVSYPANLNDNIIRNSYQVIAFVPIGSVEFAPSREALRPTPTTNATISEISDRLRFGLETAAQRAIDNAPSYPEALSESVKWRQMFKHNAGLNWEYRSVAVPERFKTPGRDIIITSKNDYKLGAHSRYDTVEANLCQSSLFVHDYTLSNFTANHKKKLNKYTEDTQLDGIQHYILTPKLLDSVWIPETRIIDWETISKIKIPRNVVNSRGRISGSYDICENGIVVQEKVAEDLDTNLPLFWIPLDLVPRWSSSEEEKLLTKYHPGCTIVRLGGNRVNKFKRDFPMAKNAIEGIKELYNKKVVPQLTPMVKDALSLKENYSVYAQLSSMDASRIEDPELVKFIKIANLDISNISKGIREFDDCGISTVVTNTNIRTASRDAFYGKYPMIAQIRNTPNMMDHIYTYINAWYNQTKEN